MDNKDIRVIIEIKDNGFLYRKEWLWVLTLLQKAIFKLEHDTKIAGHIGINKILEFIIRNFWWPGIVGSVRDYVRNYYEYQCNKTPRHAPADLF